MDEDDDNSRPTLVIVGAGFGGLGLLWRLREIRQSRRAAEEDANSSIDNRYRIVLVSESEAVSIGGTWQFAVDGRLPLSELVFPLRDSVLLEGVDEVLLGTTVSSWDRGAKQLTVVVRGTGQGDGGQTGGGAERIIHYDRLVLACGAVSNPTPIPGLDSVPSLCSFDDVPRMQRQLAQLIDRSTKTAAAALSAADDAAAAAGTDTTNEQQQKQQQLPAPLLTFVMAISRLPYKCPPAPLESICLVEDALAKAGVGVGASGVRDRVRLVLTCPVEWPMPLKTRSAFLEKLAARNIEYKPMHSLERIEIEDGDTDGDDTSTSTRTLVYAPSRPTGQPIRIKADYVWAVYPLRAPAFCRPVVAAEVSPSPPPPPFVRVTDRRTFSIDEGNGEAGTAAPPSSEQVHYAIGDAAMIAIVEKPQAQVMPMMAFGRKGGGGGGRGKVTVPKNGEFAWKMGTAVADALFGSEENIDVEEGAPATATAKKKVDVSGTCVAELGRGEGILLSPDFTNALSTGDCGKGVAGLADDSNDGLPTFELEVVSHGAAARKAEWANGYLRRIFGEDTDKLLKLPEE